MNITPVEAFEMINKCQHIIIKEGSNKFSVETFSINRSYASGKSGLPFLRLNWTCYQDFDGGKVTITYERDFYWDDNQEVKIDGCSMFLIPEGTDRPVELNLFYDPMNLENYYNWNIKS